MTIPLPAASSIPKDIAWGLVSETARNSPPRRNQKPKRPFAKSRHRSNGVRPSLRPSKLPVSPKQHNVRHLAAGARQVCPNAATQDQGISWNLDHEGLLGQGSMQQAATQADSCGTCMLRHLIQQLLLRERGRDAALVLEAIQQASAIVEHRAGVGSGGRPGEFLGDSEGCPCQ